MVYRGGDLELRTPQGLPASGRGTARETEGGANGWRSLSDDRADHRPPQEEPAEPIWVDDIVMDCCNQAFELASAHRAGEVRLDHLLHALTVVEGALTALEQKGIRTAPLRRETGARIAADIPLPAGAPPPRRSSELQKTLNRASAWAYARRRPVSVLDLMTVLLQAPREWAGVDLVHQFTDDWSFRDSTETRERVRVAALSQYTSEPAPVPTPPSYVTQAWATRMEPQPAPIQRDEPQPPPELARALAQVAERLQSINVLERKLGDFEQVLSGLAERLSGIERGLQDGGRQNLNGLSAITERLGAVEQKLEGIQPEHPLGALEARLADIERQGIETGLLISAADETLKAISARASDEQNDVARLAGDVRTELSGMSTALELQRTNIISAISQTVRESLPQQAPHAPLPPEVLSKIAQAETALGALDGRIDASGQALSREFGHLNISLNRELGQFHENLVKLNVNQKTIAEGMDQWRLDTTADLGTLNGRIEEVERTTAKMSDVQDTLQSSVEYLYRRATRWRDHRERLRQKFVSAGERLHWLKPARPVEAAKEIPSATPEAGPTEGHASATRLIARRERATEWLNNRMMRARNLTRFRQRKIG